MKKNLKINSSAIWLRNFPWKKKRDHKYSRGKLIIFGSQINMTGSTILSSESALRVGTGSVKIISAIPNFFKSLAVTIIASAASDALVESRNLFLLPPDLLDRHQKPAWPY